MTQRLTLADRLAYAAIGATLGALAGGLAAPLIGSFPLPQDLGTSGLWSVKGAAIGALVCAVAGFALGPRTGDVAGAIVEAAFALHVGSEDRHVPRWVTLVFWVVVAIVLWHWLS